MLLKFCHYLNWLVFALEIRQFWRKKKTNDCIVKQTRKEIKCSRFSNLLVVVWVQVCLFLIHWCLYNNIRRSEEDFFILLFVCKLGLSFFFLFFSERETLKTRISIIIYPEKLAVFWDLFCTFFNFLEMCSVLKEWDLKKENYRSLAVY